MAKYIFTISTYLLSVRVIFFSPQPVKFMSGKRVKFSIKLALFPRERNLLNEERALARFTRCPVIVVTFVVWVVSILVFALADSGSNLGGVGVSVLGCPVPLSTHT